MRQEKRKDFYDLQMVAFECGIVEHIETFFVLQGQVSVWVGTDHCHYFTVFLADGVMHRSVAVAVLQHHHGNHNI